MSLESNETDTTKRNNKSRPAFYTLHGTSCYAFVHRPPDWFKIRIGHPRASFMCPNPHFVFLQQSQIDFRLYTSSDSYKTTTFKTALVFPAKSSSFAPGLTTSFFVDRVTEIHRLSCTSNLMIREFFFAFTYSQNKTLSHILHIYYLSSIYLHSIIHFNIKYINYF